MSYGNYNSGYGYDDEYYNAFDRKIDDNQEEVKRRKTKIEVINNIQEKKIFDEDILQEFKVKKYIKLDVFQELYKNRGKLDKKLRENIMNLKMDIVDSILKKGFNNNSYKSLTKDEIMQNLEKAIMFAETSSIYQEKEINIMIDIWLAIEKVL